MNKSVAAKFVGATALAASSQAYGQIVNITPPSNLAGSTNAETFEYYDVLTGTTSATPTGADDFRFGVYNGPNYFFTDVTPLKTTDGVAVAPGGFYDAAIPAGARIGSDTYSFQAGGAGNNSFTVLAQSYPDGTVTSYQQPNTNTFLGFQFADSTGVIHNGYVELDSVPYVSDANPGGLEFVSGAYNSLPADSPNGAGDIEAGEMAVPEPGTISSLVLGAAALGMVGLARRRRSAFALAQD